MKKYRLLVFILAFLLLFGLMSTAAFAKTVTVTKDAGVFTVDIDGIELKSDVPPRVENGTTLVPMRVIFEALNATVDYHHENKTINAYRDTTNILLTLNSATAFVNGVPKTLAVPAKAVNGRTLVPLRFVSEALGETVNYVVKIANDPNNTTASSYKDTYYAIAENMADASTYDNNAISALQLSYTYADQYRTYGDSLFLQGSKTQYAKVVNYTKVSLELTNKAIGNCGGFTEYVALKSTLRSITDKYNQIINLCGTYSATNLDKVIDCYSEVSMLWNKAMNQWTVQKP